MNKKTILIGLSLVVLSRVFAATPGLERPNIVFILTDDQRRHQCNYLPEGISANGKQKNLTPTMDRLASEGVVFPNMQCPSPLCVPSRFGMLTGQYASRAQNSWFTDLHKIHGHTFIHQEPKLTPAVPTLASKLKTLGYTTGFIGKNHSIEAHEYTMVDARMDINDPALKKQVARNTRAVHDAIHRCGFDYVGRVYHTNPMVSGPKDMAVHNMEWVTEGALEFLEQAKGKPFFMFYATTVPHGPHDGWQGNPLGTPEGMLEKAPDVLPDRATLMPRLNAVGIDKGHADLLWLDDSVAALINKLEAVGELDNTIIFYVNDHGVESGKTTVYQGGMHTFGFVWGPEKYVKGKRVADAMCSTVDIAPTMYDLVGGRVAEGGFDGVSYRSILEGKADAVRKTVYGEIGHTRAVIKGNYKYIALRYSDYTSGMSLKERQLWLDAANAYRAKTAKGKDFSGNNPDGPFGHSGYIPDGWDHEQGAMKKYPAYFENDQLYDLAKDPDEQVNLAADPEYAEILADLKAELKKELQSKVGGFAEFKFDEYAESISEEERLNIVSKLRTEVFH